MTEQPKKNRTGGPPKPFSHYLVKGKFPQTRPIFWAGEQDTINPGTYVEPGKVPSAGSLMSIPQTIRFVVGGRDSDTPPPPPPTAYMVQVLPSDLLTGTATIHQNVQLTPVSFNIDAGLPLMGTYFWRLIEYTQTQATIDTPLGSKIIFSVLKSGQLDGTGLYGSGSDSFVAEGGNIFIPVSGVNPIQTGPEHSGSYSIECFWTIQYSSDGITWSTDPLSAIFPPGP